MAETSPVEEESVPVPLLRDPPLPPGYTDPLEASGILDEPFAAHADDRADDRAGDGGVKTEPISPPPGPEDAR